MKKIIKAIGIIAILGSVAVASTSSVTEVSKEGVKDATTVQMCDPIMQLLDMCRSTQTPLSEY